jgi:hypothetical protein
MLTYADGCCTWDMLTFADVCCTCRSAQQRIADKAQADYEALQSELAQRQYMLKIIQDLCCKIFLQRETDEALKAHAAALHAIDVMAIDTPVSLDPQSEQKGLVKTALSQA